MEAITPTNEHDRLLALYEFDILDTLPEEAFDRITRLASQIFDTPIAVVSLVDKDRQWFKSIVGLDASETPREIAFCSHAILDTEVMVVNDARLDDRFADNPLVQGSPDIRFYAGAPLMITDDIRLGTLCAIDTEPREITEQQTSALRDLAAVVVDELNLRRQLAIEVQTSEELAQQAAELRFANQALEQFAHMASHDLRAPLKKVINLADLALASDGDAGDLIRMIRSAGVELEQMIVGYYRLARLEYRNSEDHAVSRLIELGRNQAEHAIDVEVRGDATLACDPTLMAQAMANLINNAGRHGCENLIVFDVEVSGSDLRLQAINAVDSSLQVDNSIFAPFRRLRADSTGTGLGLAIVDRIVKLHGGTADASCDAGQFSITLQLPVLCGE